MPVRAAYSHSPSVGRRNAGEVQRFLEQVGAPYAECCRLFPGNAYHRIIVIARMREIHTHIRFVVSIVEIVHPATFVRIDIHDTGVEEIPRPAEPSCDGFVHDLAFLGDVGRVFGYHDHFVRVDLDIGVTHAGCRVQVVFAKGC